MKSWHAIQFHNFDQLLPYNIQFIGKFTVHDVVVTDENRSFKNPPKHSNPDHRVATAICESIFETANDEFMPIIIACFTYLFSNPERCITPSATISVRFSCFLVCVLEVFSNFMIGWRQNQMSTVFLQELDASPLYIWRMYSLHYVILFVSFFLR